MAEGSGTVRQATLPSALSLVKSSVSELVARLEQHRVLQLVGESPRGGRELRLSPDTEIAFGLPHPAHPPAPPAPGVAGRRRRG